jgi:leukotriene B4 12-hydroxydehydrogenase/15-oxo-prostaglandin 13-reductase
MSTATSAPLPSVCRQFTLAARPVGLPKETDFKLVEAPMPEPGDGEVLLKTVYVSVDPYMRGRITGVKSYADPINIGDVMIGGSVGQVVQSKSPAFQPGDFAVGFWGWRECAVESAKSLQKLDPAMAPVSLALGLLGMPGMTAHFGFLEICNPKPGETVLVSGAAGAVGSIVGQIAKIKECRVVGIAGGDDKIAWLLNELGFDAAFNYKTTNDYVSKLKELCPQGIDCYFDNVGGAITDAVFPLLNTFARVSVCGQISQYNLEKPEPGPRLLPYILVKQVRVEGFIVTRFAPRFREGFEQMAAWLREGKLKYQEYIVEGFENIPKAFIGMLQGKNTGKMLVKV